MKYNPQIHHRRSIRLQGYDYGQEGLYFITICCQDRAHLFGEIKNGEMMLNRYGEIAFQEWQRTEAVRSNCRLHAFVVMPNHLHGIIEIVHQHRESTEAGIFRSPSQTIGAIVRGYKIAVIKKIKDLNQDNQSETSGDTQARKEDGMDENKGEYEDDCPDDGHRGLLNDGKRENKDGKGEEKSASRDDSESKGDDKGDCKREGKGEGKGELQFAPTTAPTTAATKAPTTAPTLKIWQRNYYEHIIRNEAAYEKISAYIRNNPASWKDDRLR